MWTSLGVPVLPAAQGTQSVLSKLEGVWAHRLQCLSYRGCVLSAQGTQSVVSKLGGAHVPWLRAHGL